MRVAATARSPVSENANDGADEIRSPGEEDPSRTDTIENFNVHLISSGNAIFDFHRVK